MELILDLKQFDDDIKTLGNKLPGVITKFIDGQLDELAKNSQALVPYGLPEDLKEPTEPHLKDTMVIEYAKPGQVYTGAISYTADYAFDVHENPRSGRTGGFSPSGAKYSYYARDGSFKFLEQPTLLMRATFAQDFAVHVAFSV